MFLDRDVHILFCAVTVVLPDEVDAADDDAEGGDENRLDLTRLLRKPKVRG